MNNFHICIVSEEFNDSIENFMTEEWISANLEHFGRQISPSEWGSPLNIVAFESDKMDSILGVARCNIVGKTLRISQLLVKTEFRRKQNIGSLLLQKAERICIEENWHKLRLSTSEQHNVLDFYLKNGFSIEATLKNDAFNLNWMILSKFIAKH